MKILAGIAVLLIGILAGVLIAGRLGPVGMIVYSGSYGEAHEITPEDMETIPHLSLEGFSEASADVSGDTLYLFSGCRRISMLVGEGQAESIKNGMAGSGGFRPTSHDTMKNILDAFGMKPIMVKITDMSEGVYFARLLIIQGSRILNLDSRPSDAVAIAVRTDTPVYVKQSLMEEEGEIVC
jgi:bifunctional DNase/RNase